jgi:hypothetical protein
LDELFDPFDRATIASRTNCSSDPGSRSGFMRLKFAAALALAAASFTGCYRSMYAPPYGYSSPGYGGYPGPINTLQPGQQYVPGGAMQPGGTFVQPYQGGDAAPYNPAVPGNNSATRPAPTYPDAGSDASGINSMGMIENAPVLQRTGNQTFASPEPMPLNTATPAADEFSTPAATANSEFGGTQSPGDATLNKPVLPQIPISYRPFSTAPRQLRRTPAY